MRLSAPVQSGTLAAGRQPSAFCPFPSLTRWLADDDLTALVQHAGGAQRYRCWPMERVVWAQVLQALGQGRSQSACVQTLCQALGLDIAAYSGSFCKARGRLAPRVPQLAAQWVARGAAARAPRPAAGHGRRVVQWDGSSCSLSDGPANQAAYPQPAGQQPGCGFPHLRFVAMRDAASGCFLALSFGNRFDHDAKLGAPLWDQLQPEDILVVDRGFASYGLLWGMTQRGCGVVMRQHQGRKRADDLVGDLDDQTMVWPRPRADERGAFWDDDLPRTLTVRVVRCRLADGRPLVLNTNLGPEFSAADIVALYAGRWDQEGAFRDLKETLALDPLAAGTPRLAQTLVWAYVLAYNLVRAEMVAAAAASGQPLARLSVAHTRQVLELSLWLPADAGEAVGVRVLQQIAAYRTPDRRRRPGAPRRVKRRQTKYPLLTRPRAEYPARERAG